MIVIPFKRILEAVIRRQKGNPEAALTEAPRCQSIAQGANRRLLEGWTFAWWPETMRIEQRFFRADWNVATAYATGAQVYSPATTTYYECIQANTGQPVTDPLYWTALTYFDSYIAWEQAGCEAIGRARNPGYSADPNTTVRVREHRFTLSNSGIQFNSAQVGAYVYLNYQLRPPAVGFNEFTAGTAYSPNDVVYSSADGECYLCLVATDSADLSNATYWKKQEIPAFMEKYLVSAAFAETLRDDGNGEGADREDARAQAELERLYERYILATGQAGRITVRVR